MKNGIVNIWLLGLIVVFIALFSAYIIININYSKSFKMKNEVLSIIEKHKGVTKTIDKETSGQSLIASGQTITVNVNTIKTINLYLMGNNYDAKGFCPSNNPTDDGSGYYGYWYGVSALRDGSSIASDFEPVQDNKKYFYCFAKYNANHQSGRYKAVYYKVRLFYKFEVPALENFLSVKVEGTTDEVYHPQDENQNITVIDFTS